MNRLAQEAVCDRTPTTLSHHGWLATNAFELNAIFTTIETAAHKGRTHAYLPIERPDIRAYLEKHGYRIQSDSTIRWDTATVLS